MQVQHFGVDLNRSSLYVFVPLYLKVHTFCFISHTLLSFSPVGNKFKLTNQLSRIHYLAISYLALKLLILLFFYWNHNFKLYVVFPIFLSLQQNNDCANLTQELFLRETLR